MNAAAEVIIAVRELRTQFGATVIHDGLDLDIRRGEIVALVGGSGSGKTTLLRAIIMLLKPVAGSIPVSYTHLDVYKRQVWNG